MPQTFRVIAMLAESAAMAAHKQVATALELYPALPFAAMAAHKPFATISQAVQHRPGVVLMLVKPRLQTAKQPICSTATQARVTFFGTRTLVQTQCRQQTTGTE